ncbi:metallophosphoesterase [Chloroherpeton thalassium ATCC 35110]|uniref:Metallophosphoesterase n=1 Tax=Chloroherpeton thalassium (strain ATCC 35110 / GB-78) TaxID=517418 RepID=B3QV73_CHLT3|nr:metallophosphoesterase family protein [Chloroherpeton thalassium]ACF13027.1 metallophosphoesterase [Chloroherpeton thalassium ATCC 35110]
MPQDETGTKNIIAIGDIHGCILSLKALIQKLDLSEKPQLVFLGDYVDRGPNSKGVIDFLIELNDSYPCVFLKGNHEVMMQDYLIGDCIFDNWKYNGGTETLASYQENGHLSIPSSHLKFLAQCRYTYETDDYVFVHGGLKPEFSIRENLENGSNESMVWERTHLSKEAISTEHPNWEKTVICGHTPQHSPLLLKRLICIDTGCVYYSTRPGFGRLTAIELPSRKITQVENQDLP